jgi:hypothetical protein
MEIQSYERPVPPAPVAPPAKPSGIELLGRNPINRNALIAWALYLFVIGPILLVLLFKFALPAAGVGR